MITITQKNNYQCDQAKCSEIIKKYYDRSQSLKLRTFCYKRLVCCWHVTRWSFDYRRTTKERKTIR